MQTKDSNSHVHAAAAQSSDLTIDSYPLGRSDHETRRLILQHQLYAPITRQVFVDAGICPGMKVLDVGSGAGDVALLIADLVGPQGEVIGVDMNPDILDVARRRAAAAGWSNVTFRRADLDSFELDETVDAIVGRWVLMYIPEPAKLLARLARRVRPGGVVAFVESDLTRSIGAYPPAPLHQSLLALTPPPNGMPHQAMGLDLFRAFLDAGLPAPQLSMRTPVGGGPDWPGYEYVSATVRSVLPFMQGAHGVEIPELDLDRLEERLRREVVENNGIQILVPVIGAASRI